MAGLIMPWSVGMLSGGGADPEVFVGTEYSDSAVNSDTWGGTRNFGRTVDSAETVIFAVACCDNDTDDSTWSFDTSTGWTLHREAGNRASTTDSAGGAIHSRTGLSGTGVSFDQSLTGFGGTMDAWCGIMLSVVGGTASVIGTAECNDSNTLTVDVTGADFVVIAGGGHNASTLNLSGGGDINQIAAVNIGGDNNKARVWIDYAPTGGTYTTDDSGATYVAVAFAFD